MTRTINLLSPEALERLMAGPEGTDVAMDPDNLAPTPLGLCDLAAHEVNFGGPHCRTPRCVDWTPLDPEPLPGVAGWEGAPLSATVDCGTCQHRVAFGECCPRCDANCSLPDSPANEEK